MTMTQHPIQYDIIGDVHGHAQTLAQLLEKIGYSNHRGFYQHPERKALFAGDLIDRGPENFKTLDLVRAMVDNNSAVAIMGNHEYNALCYHTRDKDGHFLRPNNQKNYQQHKKVLAEITQYGEKRWIEYMEWFRHLPLFFETGTDNREAHNTPPQPPAQPLRVVHACWHNNAVNFLRRNHGRDHHGRLTDEFLIESARKGSETFIAVEAVLKGQEIILPSEHPGIYDRDNNLRKKLRLKWWMSPQHRRRARTYDQVVRADEKELKKISHLQIPEQLLAEFIASDDQDYHIPVFFGHYWFSGDPHPLTETRACTDYSLARGGQLVCYRWDGHIPLKRENFVSKKPA